MTSDTLVKEIEKNLDQNKAEDLVTIDIRGKSSVADFLVIGTGTSGRHVGALASHLENMLRKGHDTKPIIEGKEGGDWVLVDAGYVVVHLFRDEVRQFYQLEKMWGLETPASKNPGTMTEASGAF